MQEIEATRKVLEADIKKKEDEKTKHITGINAQTREIEQHELAFLKDLKVLNEKMPNKPANYVNTVNASIDDQNKIIAVPPE